MKPFDIELAKAGHPVCTRDGRKVRILCFDRKDSHYHIVALIENAPEDEEVVIYPDTGIYDASYKSDEDLMLFKEKKEGWVNIYDADTTFYFVEGRVCNTKEEAIKLINPDHEIYTTTVKIEWEE